MSQIFISYSRKDIDFVRKLAGDLEKAGYTVWWDVSHLRGGDDWVRVIPQAIAASDYFIVVLSPRSILSEWVEKEYTQALYLRKKIIPILLESTTVPFALNTINYLDFTSTADYSDRFNALLLALDYGGTLPVTPAPPFPLTLRGLVVPILVSVIILALTGFFVFSPTAVLPTITPAIPASPTITILPTSSATGTPSDTATSTPSPTLTSTRTETPTSTQVPTATATVEVVESLPFCVSRLLSEVSAVNVRTGPGTGYPPFEDPLRVGKCLTFWAVSEDGLWLLVANSQTDPGMQKFEGGWVRRDLLVPGLIGNINLPVFTLTPTPQPSDTPTMTPTLPPSETPTLTPTETETPTP